MMTEYIILYQKFTKLCPHCDGVFVLFSDMVILTSCSTNVMGISSFDLCWCIVVCFINS